MSKAEPKQAERGKGGETGATAEPKTKDKQTDRERERERTKGSQKQIQKCEQFGLAREGGGWGWRGKAGRARQLVTFGAWHFVKRETETRINANVI